MWRTSELNPQTPTLSACTPLVNASNSQVLNNIYALKTDKFLQPEPLHWTHIPNWYLSISIEMSNQRCKLIISKCDSSSCLCQACPIVFFLGNGNSILSPTLMPPRTPVFFSHPTANNPLASSGGSRSDHSSHLHHHHDHLRPNPAHLTQAVVTVPKLFHLSLPLHNALSNPLKKSKSNYAPLLKTLWQPTSPHSLPSDLSKLYFLAFSCSFPLLWPCFCFQGFAIALDSSQNALLFRFYVLTKISPSRLGTRSLPYLKLHLHHLKSIQSSSQFPMLSFPCQSPQWDILYILSVVYFSTRM